MSAALGVLTIVNTCDCGQDLRSIHGVAVFCVECGRVFCYKCAKYGYDQNGDRKYFQCPGCGVSLRRLRPQICPEITTITKE